LAEPDLEADRGSVLIRRGKGGLRYLRVTPIYLQGIDRGEIIETVRSCRPQVIPAAAALARWCYLSKATVSRVPTGSRSRSLSGPRPETPTDRARRFPCRCEPTSGRAPSPARTHPIRPGPGPARLRAA